MQPLLSSATAMFTALAMNFKEWNPSWTKNKAELSMTTFAFAL
jgi:hypothetical protein